MSLIERNIATNLATILESSRAAALIGPRQSGKSTLATSLSWGGSTPDYLTFDDDVLRRVAAESPYEFVKSIPRPSVLDEIQRVPQIMLSVKRVLDEEPEARGQFLLTGSTNLLTNRLIADTLPGRVQYLNLWPFAQAEIEGTRVAITDRLLAGSVPQLSRQAVGRIAHADRVIVGGFPESRQLGSEFERTNFFESYLRSIVDRELPEIGATRTDPGRVEQLLRLLAARTGSAANLSRLARDLVTSDVTVRAHLELLEQLFMVVRLRPWSLNLGARQVKAPKFYVSDTGLASAFAGMNVDSYCDLRRGEAAGAMFETFVVTEVLKAATWGELPARLHHYRDNVGREVDLVIETNSGDVAAIEVKSSTSVGSKAARGIEFLRDKLGDRFRAGVVVYTGERTLRLGDRIWAMPVQGLWMG